MPTKKNKNKKQNNEHPLEKLAKKILVNSQKTFYFGANNKGSTPVSCQQAVFIQDKINSLANDDNLFEIRLKKSPIRYLNKIKSIRQQYIKERNPLLGLELLGFFYNDSVLKKQFENKPENKEKKIKWNDRWLDDLKLIWATSYSEQYRKNNYSFSHDESKTYDKFRSEGVPDKGNEREIYFERTFFDLKAATLHGTGACELMAEFALFEAIRMSKELDCPIHYIRFLSSEYEEINAIALGNWPNEDSLVVCPWLEKGENLIWKKDLHTTRFSKYLEEDIKIIFKIFPGDEMDEWKEALATVSFLPDAEEKQTIKNRIEELSEKYIKAFDECFLSKNVDEVQSAPIRSFRR